MSGARLSEADIDGVIARLRAEDREWIRRGRGGHGLGHRAGVFYSIYVEEFDQWDSPFEDEAALRKYLAELDLSERSNQYLDAVLADLGVQAWADVADVVTRGQALDDARKVAIPPRRRWRGVVDAASRDRLTWRAPALPPLHAVLLPEVASELGSVESWVGALVGVEGLVREAPSGDHEIPVVARGHITRF